LQPIIFYAWYVHHYAYTDHFYSFWKLRKQAGLPLEDINNVVTAIFTCNFSTTCCQVHSTNSSNSTKNYMNIIQEDPRKYTWSMGGLIIRNTLLQGCHIWNKLPIEILQSKTLQIFTNKLKKYYLNTMDVKIWRVEQIYLIVKSIVE